MVRNDFNKVHVGETKKGKVCCKYRTIIIKKTKLILQKILRKYDLEITTLLSCKYYVRLSERGRKELLRRHIREKTVIEAVQKLFKI